MRNRNDEEAVARVCDASECIVPGQEGCEEAKIPASFNAGGVRCSTAVLQVANTKQEEGHVESEEEQEECDGRLERTNEEDRGEDEPSLVIFGQLLSL